MSNKNDIMRNNDLAKPDNMMDLTVDIVSAYVANNQLPAKELPVFMMEISSTLHKLAHDVDDVQSSTQEDDAKPAVSKKKSLGREKLTCMNCGQEFKSLKKHIKSAHDLTPEQYRQRWSLTPDYPMVAPAYAETRSNLARQLGLGRKAA